MIVNTQEEFANATKTWKGPIACDTETYGKAWEEGRKLLGVSLSDGVTSVYIPMWVYGDGGWRLLLSEPLREALHTFLSSTPLIGHNFTYDKRWLGLAGFTTQWAYDTRIMWHMASAPAGPRPYGLKDAQKELLGWAETNEKELELNVKAKGGLLRNGDHYLADLPVIAKYACLDTLSTWLVWGKLRGFFDSHSYWPLLRSTMAYNELLEDNTYIGVACDKEGLIKANKRLLGAKEAARKRFYKHARVDINSLEEDWKDRRVALYKREYNKTHYLQNPDKWERFNLNSDAHKRELFYGKWKFPVIGTTEGGKPSTGADNLKFNTHPAVEGYLKYEKANTLTTSFTGPYLDSLGPDSRLHPGFNICGTVSYRLSGFKPYLLNAPFDEKYILRNLKCDPGFGGVHADLSAIEPTITAHFSDDPHLLKVFRDGLGDIYLDLALTLFPRDKELHEGYNPGIPITKAVKERFARQRKVAKVVQLAVQYTGTGHTVAKNLTKDGVPTTVEQANVYVYAYWRKFRKVAQFNDSLQALNKKKGYLRNVIGRIIRVPYPDYKDLPNRFIQSSAHDVLILWVLEIYQLCKAEAIDIRPILLDCHDSTSNQVPLAFVERTKQLYQIALNNVVDQLQLSVNIKAEIKTFSTLAGLKQDE